MKLKYKLLLIIVILLVNFISIGCVYAQDYSVIKSENGQTFIIKEVHDNPIVTIDTWIRTGSINETDKNNGVAHFLEHLFFKGTAKHPTGEFDKILESKGAETNAATSKDFTHYYITIPSKHFETALELHADMLLNPLIPRKELEKERKVVLEEIAKNLDNPDRQLYETMTSAFYSNHPYKRKVIGEKEIIENITREEIMDFYERWYNPSNMITVIVGDISTENAVNLIKKNFTKKELKKQKEVVYRLDKKIDKQTEIITKGKIKNGYMLIGFQGVPQEKRDDGYALDVLMTILGDGRSSKLYQSVKEQKQLAFSIYAGHSSMKDDSLLYIRADFSPTNKEKLKKAIFCELEKVMNGNIDEQDINIAKNIIERETFYARESTSNIANALGYTTLVYGDTKYYTEYISNIKKVTKSDIIRVAKKYLNPNHAVISIMLPEQSEEKEIKKINNTEKKSFEIIQKHKNITKYKLPNNITLIINHNELNDIVAMQIFAKGGSFIEKKPGIGSIVANTMMKGTKNYSQQDLSQTMEQNGIKISTNQGSDFFTISVKTTKNDLPLTFELLNEIANNATLAPQEIEKIKSEMLYSIHTNRDTPVGVAFEEFKTIAFDGTPYGYSGKVLEKFIPNIKQSDVLEFYNSIFCPENLVISINGNVDDNKIIKDILDIFDEKKDCKAQKFEYKNYTHLFKPLNKNKISKIEKNAEAAWLILGWLTDGTNNNNKREVITLQVINSLLGSGMSSRLFADLRGEQGLAYQVGSSYMPNINKGIFAVYIGTNPQKVQHSQNELLKQINRLKKEFVSEKELQEAKDKILGNFVLSQETNMEKASLLGRLEASGKGFDYIYEFPDLVQSISVADVIKVANKYFDNPYIMTIVAPNTTFKQQFK